MANITSEDIRDIAIKATEMFLNDKIPLSTGLSKLASFHELNSEQTKRAIEATNSICFLKAQEVTGDRTTEFPLAKYAEVMSGIVDQSLTKAAESLSTQTSTIPEVKTDQPMVKEASFGGWISNLPESERVTFLVKMASENEMKLGQLKDREITIVPEITKLASVIKKDSQWLEKLAFVSEGCEFRTLSVLVSGDVSVHKNTGIFKEADLKQVKQLKDLYKEATELQKEIRNRTELFSGSKTMIKEASIFENLGKGTGRLLGGIAAAPIKAATPLVKNTATRVGNQITNIGRKAVGAAALPVSKKIGVGTVIGAAAAPVGNAMIYKPKGDKATGSSGDVWDALQRQ